MNKHLQMLFAAFFLLCSFSLSASYLRDIPVTVTQPNGEVIKCYASGDEFFNYLHDDKGFTIIQNIETGYYMYAVSQGSEIVPSEMFVGKGNPRNLGVEPHLTISAEEWTERRVRWNNSMIENMPSPAPVNVNKTIDEPIEMDNLVIFIRFEDETELTTNFSTVDFIFNDSTTTATNSMYNFFRSATYDQMLITSSYFPAPNGNTIVSYEDIYPRGYYQPYSSANPQGYSGDNQRTSREHQLLERAVNYVDDLVPESLNIDHNNDGYVDNICFVVKGDVDGWSDLLWPHRWALYTETCYINNKQVWDFNFVLEGAAGYFNTAVISHEMSHTFSFPDLYHYGGNANYTPVGAWDIMASTAQPAQQHGAYLKYKYGDWLPEPTTIVENGTYTLHSVGGQDGGIKCYQIPTNIDNEFIMLEYRNEDDLFENTPGTGVLIYRVNTDFDGNADWDDTSEFDEIYIFRPNGTLTANGSLNSAHFGVSGRTEFNSTTSPYPFHTNGTMIDGIEISNITLHGDSATFTFETNDCIFNYELEATNLLENQATIISPNINDTVSFQYVFAAYSESNNPDNLNATTITGAVFPLTLNNLSASTDYQFWIRKICNATEGQYSNWILLEFSTACGAINSFPWEEGFEPEVNCWTINHVEGEQDWFLRPSTGNSIDAYEGNYFVSYFSSSNSEAVSKLITPTFDLSSLINPYITFYHIQPDWNGDQNTLTVYYRTSPSSNWVELESYTDDISSWTSETLMLPNPSATYQIAFEAYDTYGYDVGIDAVMVDGETNNPCAQPINITATAESYDAIEVTWSDTTANAVEYIVRYKVLNTQQWTEEITQDTSLLITNLEGSTTYQIQVSTACTDTTQSYWAPQTPVVVVTENTPQFNITATAHGPGTITPEGTGTYDEESTPTYTFQPDANAIIERIEVSGVEVNNYYNSYTFEPLFSNESIDVYFILNTGIEENNQPSYLQLYPNPTSNELTISSTNANITHIEVMDMVGRSVITQSISTNDAPTIQVSHLNSGTYFVRVSTELGVEVMRFVKQ